ncbi:MAG: hypothetical protein M3Z32_13510, partial [Acidobacteriota bacterium]|nr:hypothetical protein [Acidobacteriota bacterium]
MQYDWDWARAEQEVRAALASGPSASAELRYAQILMSQRRFSEVDEHLLRSQQIDPVGVRYMLARGQMWMLEAAMLDCGHRPEVLQMIRADEEKYDTGDVPIASFAAVYAA